MPTIHALVAAAKKPSSPGGALVTKSEIQAIVRGARANGLDATAKRTLKRELKTTEKTPAAKAELKRLANKYGFAALGDRLSDSGGSGGSVGGSSPSRGGSVGGSSGGSVGGGS